MILVAGGTGRLGSLVVRDLADRNFAIRVLTRDRRRARHLAGAGVEIVVGDVRDPRSLRRAFTQVDTVVSAVHGFAGPGHVSPRSVDEEGNANLIRGAIDRGSEMVMMSTAGAAADSPLELFRRKYAAEQTLQASGLRWTIVRATAFVELWAEILSRGVVFGRGDNPINFVSVHDVAALVVKATTDADLRGRILEIGGPGAVTMNELAGLVQSTWGRPARIHHAPPWLLRTIGPLHRQPRAALVMDTADMTFREGNDSVVGRTTPQAALSRMLPGARATGCHRPSRTG